MAKYVMRSANHESALLWPAAAFMVEPGLIRFPNNVNARMRAGAAQGLDRARSMRLIGDKTRCRATLEFARDARLFLQR